MRKINLMPVVFSLISFASAHTGNDEFDHHGMMGGLYGMMSGNWGYGGMFFGWLINLSVIAVLVLLIVWLIKKIQEKK